jgi:hypothetical protein
LPPKGACGNLQEIDGRVDVIDDPIVDEVRRQREKRAAKFKFDVRAIARDAMKRQRSGRRKTVSFARPVAATK